MKSTGIVRHIDPLGRLVLPMELRKTLGIAQGDAMEIFVEGDKIVLAKYTPGCTFCGSQKNVRDHKGKQVCLDCEVELVAGE